MAEEQPKDVTLGRRLKSQPCKEGTQAEGTARAKVLRLAWVVVKRLGNSV